MTPQEPHKYKVLAYLKGGAKPARQALCVVQAPPRNSVFEALVDLDGTRASILSWQEVRGPLDALYEIHSSFSPLGWAVSGGRKPQMSVAT